MKKTLLAISMVLCAFTMNAQVQVLADTSLESSGSAATTDWTSTSTNFTTSLCDANCGTGGGSCVPRTGSWYCWFGGATALEDGTLDQTFTVASGGNGLLKFYYALALPSQSTNDSTKVLLDGVMLWGTSGLDSVTYPRTYTLVSIPLTGVSTGSHNISFVGHESGTATTSYNSIVDDITLNVGGAIGFTEYSFDEGVMIGTDREQQSLNLSFNLPSEMNMSIQITDMYGRIVDTKELTSFKNGTIQFSTSEYSAGIYTIVMNNGKGTIARKVLIQK